MIRGVNGTGVTVLGGNRQGGECLGGMCPDTDCVLSTSRCVHVPVFQSFCSLFIEQDIQY